MRAYLICLLFLSGIVQAQPDSCHLRFEIKGLQPGKVKFIAVFADQNYIIDSAMADDLGRFGLKRTRPLPTGYFYCILPDYSNFHFMVGDEQFFSMTAEKSDIVSTMSVDGSIDNEMLYENFRMQEWLDPRLDSLYKRKSDTSLPKATIAATEVEIDKLNGMRKEQLLRNQRQHPNALYTKFKTAGQNPEPVDVRKPNGEVDRELQLEYFRQAFWDNVDFTDERLLRTPVVANKLKRFIMDLTPQHPDSIIRQVDFVISKAMANKEMFKFVSNWIAIKFQPTQTKVMDGEAVFVHVLENYFDTKEKAYWASDKELAEFKKKVLEMKASLLNRQGPDVVSTDFYGMQRSIYELKEEFVVIFMYDPDCDHCQKETPLLKEFYKKWKSKGVEIFAIVLNSTDEEWRNFVNRYGTNEWINVHDPTNRSIYAKYFVDITPEIYVLNRDRKIIGKNLKAEQIPVIIEQEYKRQGKM
ncbi:MAG: Thiol-disulfide oxidoreductase ResA [Saprospiraceae bacterium]|nr:Thiol-disulfide oxidoreductase ResA [Saprospiraceae bacterium]